MATQFRHMDTVLPVYMGPGLNLLFPEGCLGAGHCHKLGSGKSVQHLHACALQNGAGMHSAGATIQHAGMQ